MDYVPELPVEREVVKTYADGRWGLREYSRWPQMLVNDMWHIACIPTTPSPSVPEVLWRTLCPTDWEADRLTGVADLGYIKDDIRTKLSEAAKLARAKWDVLAVGSDHQAYREHGDTLLLILRLAVERMEKLPSQRGIAIAVAAHVQRVCLEIAGLCTYLDVVVARLELAIADPFPPLPVVGAFIRDPSSAQTCTRVGIPTWFLQPLTHQVKVWRIVDFRKPPMDWSDAPSDPPIYQNPHEVAGITNLTGNWVERMCLAVSKLVCGVHLAALGPGQEGLAPEAGPSAAKRARTGEAEGTDVRGKHLQMRPVDVPQAARSAGKSRRERKRLLA
ncbi:hypothetical protein OH77DRAFT_1363541, partial [Trametes cingulata]